MLICLTPSGQYGARLCINYYYIRLCIPRTIPHVRGQVLEFFRFIESFSCHRMRCPNFNPDQSAQHLLQTLKEDDFAREQIAPENGIEKSSFCEATNTRGLEQFLHVFENLQQQASHLLPDAQSSFP